TEATFADNSAREMATAAAPAAGLLPIVPRYGCANYSPAHPHARQPQEAEGFEAHSHTTAVQHGASDLKSGDGWIEEQVFEQDLGPAETDSPQEAVVTEREADISRESEREADPFAIFATIAQGAAQAAVHEAPTPLRAEPVEQGAAP